MHVCVCGCQVTIDYPEGGYSGIDVDRLLLLSSVYISNATIMSPAH